MISIIISTHLKENDIFLKKCVQSCLNQLNAQLEIIVVSSREDDLEPIYGVKIINNKDLKLMTDKIHFSIENVCDINTDGYLILNDDVVLSKHYVESMQEASKIAPMIVGGLSNNEFGSRFVIVPPLLPNLDYNEELAYWAYNQPKERLVLFPVDWISFYATYIPKTVWQQVGKLDPNIDYRHNDQDYCRRAQEKGIGTFINTATFVLHWGSKTIPKVSTKEILDAQTDYYIKKMNLSK